MDVFHNPNALHPLDPDVLPGAARHQLMPDRQTGSSSPSCNTITVFDANILTAEFELDHRRRYQSLTPQTHNVTAKS